MARLLLAAAFLGLGELGAAQTADELSLARQLELARESSTTAPWRETEALLDEIEPHLSRATPEQRAEYWLIHARNQVLAGHLARALDELEELIDKPVTLVQKVQAYRLAANTAILLRRWEEAFGYLNQALELSGQLEAADTTRAPYNLAAYIYAKIGETGQAIQYGQQALEISRQYGSARDVCISQGRLAFVFKVAGMNEQAHRHYREAASTCEETGDDLVTGTIESGHADLLRAMGRYTQAHELFVEALSRLQETDYHYGLAEARFYMARLYFEQGEHAQAESLLAQALPPLKHDQAWEYVAEAHQILGKIEFARGNQEPALEHMRQQLDARERFLDLERARQLAHLQVAFDMRSREQELALLREQRRVAELESESQRHRERLRWLVYAFAGFLFVVLLLLLLHVLRERRHFRRLAGLDSLTGLSNHTRFFDSARAMVDRASHHGRSVVLVIGDIDHFKRVNDEFGHIVGDRALQAVGQVLQNSFPEPAHLGRIGGEEFAVCLPGEPIEQLLARLDAVRSALARIDYGSNGKPLSMSFGVAELGPGEPLERLRERADEALYRAKHGGRNAVVVADHT